MKITLYAAFAALLLAAAPAFAGEGNGEPFPYAAPASSNVVTVFPRDVGANAYPNVAGLPGADLPRLAGDVLPPTGSAGTLQTANSLPAGFAEGTAVYAQAQQIDRWVAAHNAAAPAYAQARSLRPRS